MLARRILEAHWGRSIAEGEIESAYLHRVHQLSGDVNGYERKVELAIIEAAIRECSCVVIVVDQDGPANSDRLRHLRAGRTRAETSGHSLAYSSVVGVAVRVVETWLLADVLAINQALAPDPPASTRGALEDLYGDKGTQGHPKTLFAQLASTATVEVSAPYDAVATCIRLDILEQRCPKGFAALASEIRRRCR